MLSKETIAGIIVQLYCDWIKHNAEAPESLQQQVRLGCISCIKAVLSDGGI